MKAILVLCGIIIGLFIAACLDELWCRNRNRKRKRGIR